MSLIKAIGIDLAKLVFSIHGVDEYGKTKLKQTVKRNKLLEKIANIPPCIIGMEACSGAHYWAREFTKYGHDVRIMASKFVIPYRQSEKNDANDAEAICEAVTRPKTRFVCIKSEEQQAVLCLHRIRQGQIKDRTAMINRLRGLLSEFGIIMPKGRYPAQKHIVEILEDAENGLPDLARELLHDLWLSIKQQNQDILKSDRKLYALANQMKDAKRLMTIPGIGEVTATAVVATVSDAKHFSTSRQFAAWIGLVPKQYSTGGKPTLGRISKRGEKHIRTSLIHGARAVIANCANKMDRTSLWIKALIERRGFKRAVIALAAKNARLIWSLLQSGQEYQVNYVKT
ncbi:IS110-like element ISSpi2 family transposase [Shewanella marinintestina]|uniref:IS110-like element ISSpi2 family transposase n=1 Tax=Shewanella marinintestina TaxID=190305 RepID=UPI00200E3530|nr:IS110-like element ISSpi2 family transposase [Shewanella marinintestina]MCL1144416.1 IS110-like element ISSpi2 family transposase [Shewanella marinintestina]